MQPQDIHRYARQTRLSVIGDTGQARIAGATIAIIGCGALGSVCAELLARAGVGTLILIDRDIVQWSNLQRQSLYTELDARRGRAKVEAAVARLRRINRSLQYVPRAIELHAANILDELKPADLWMDGTDNFDIRFLINDAALTLDKPWVHAGCVGTQGQVFTFWPKQTLCFRCLVPEPPPLASTDTCDTAGVLGPATAMVAALQSAQALRAIVHGSAAVNQKITTLDPWNLRFTQIDTDRLRNSGCPACREGRRDYLQRPLQVEAVQLCGQSAVQINAPHPPQIIDLKTLAARIPAMQRPSLTPFFLRWSEGDLRGTLFRDGRAIIEGTVDPLRAKSIYQQLLGG